MSEISVKRLDKKLLVKKSNPQRDLSYSIYIFREAKGEHRIGEQSFEISGNCIHFVSPGMQQSFKNISGIDGLLIRFTEQYFYVNTENKDLLFRLPFFGFALQHPVIQFSKSEFEKIFLIATSISEEFSEKKSSYKRIILSYLNILILKCNRNTSSLKSKPVRSDYTSLEITTKLRRLIGKHYKEEHFAGFYASKLNVTSNYLNSVVKKVTGRRPTDLIHDQIISEAKRLLIHTKLSPKEIAYDLGFDDQSYFTKYFRKHVGQNPLAWFTMNK